jgi:hypothetical protein
VGVYSYTDDEYHQLAGALPLTNPMVALSVFNADAVYALNSLHSPGLDRSALRASVFSARLSGSNIGFQTGHTSAGGDQNYSNNQSSERPSTPDFSAVSLVGGPKQAAALLELAKEAGLIARIVLSNGRGANVLVRVDMNDLDLPGVEQD